jgi:hypothetical protein
VSTGPQQTGWQETDWQEPEAPPPRPWWRRWLRRAFATLLLALAVAGAYFAYRHYRAVAALEEALAALDSEEPGWRLRDVEAARARVPDSENSASCVIETARRLPRGWPAPAFAERFDKLTPSEQLEPAAFTLLSKELDGVRPALEEARKLATRPNGRHPITFQRNVIATLLPTQQETRRVTQLLAYDVLRQAQAGDMKQALTSCRAALNAGRSVGDEPLLITMLVRTACVALACQSAERTLAQGEPAPDDLLALQRLLQHEAAFPALLVATRGERAMLHEMLDALESGDVSLFEVLGNDREVGALRKWAFGWYLRDSFRADHPRALALLTRRIAELRRPPHEQIAAEQAFAAEVRGLPKDALATRALLPALDKVGVAERRRLAGVRSMIAAVAAERYRREHGAWPESLDKLAPGLLTEVPLDPFDGRPLRYRRTADGVVVYSVGENGKDDGGKVRPEEHTQAPDVGYRLWDVKHRRQPPRPKEKAPEAPGVPGGPLP